MPYLGSTLFITTLALLILSSVLGSILLASACLGPFLERSARAASARPLRSVAVGLPLFAGVFLASAALLQGGPPARLLGALGAIVLAASSIVALASVALNVGTSLAPAASESRSRRLLRGAVVLELAASMPFFGWFVVLPIALAMGLGAAARALLSRSQSSATTPVQQPTFDAPPWDRSLEAAGSETHATRG